MVTKASCRDRQRRSGSLVLYQHFSISFLSHPVWVREKERSERVCVVRKADSWGRPCSKQAVSRDAVVPLWSCHHGSVTKGATVWFGDWLQAFHVPSFPVHPYVSTLFPQENVAVSLLSLHLRSVSMHKKTKIQNCTICIAIKYNY